MLIIVSSKNPNKPPFLQDYKKVQRQLPRILRTNQSVLIVLLDTLARPIT